MPDKLAFITEDVANLKEQGLFINIRTMESPVDAWMTVDGKRVLNFCTNNYLGLANHPKIKEAAKRAIDEWGVGPGAVRTIAGTQALHLELERRVAEFKGVEASLFVQGGFVANQIAIPALVGQEDVIFSDRLNHASIIDGCRLSRATIVVYEHCDAEDAERVIKENVGQYRRGLLVTDGVFSMDGDVAPLRRAVRGGRAVRGDHHGGRRPRRGGAGPGRARHRGPLRPARQVRRGDGDLLQGLRGGRGVAFGQEGDH